MKPTKERDQFIATLQKALPAVPAHILAYNAGLIMRHAKTHGRLAEMECNGHPIQSVCPPQGCDMKAWNARVDKLQKEHDDYIEKRTAQIEKRITVLCHNIGAVPRFGGGSKGLHSETHPARWRPQHLGRTRGRVRGAAMNYASGKEELYIYSMNKRLKIIAIADDVESANSYMEKHDNAAVIACFGPFILMADKYDKGIPK